MNTENAREDILETACHLFSEKGYDAVGVQEICEKAGITKPTLYYYFGSKKGLLQALTEEKGRQLFESLKTAGEYKHEFFDSVSDLLKAEIAFARKNQDFFRLHINLMNAPENSESAECYKELKTDISTFLLDFFTLSAEEFGNMRTKEKLNSTLFHNNLITIAAGVLSGIIDDSDESIYKITHSLIYGFAD